MGYVVESPHSYFSRVADDPGDEHCLIDRLAHDLAHVHVVGWRQAYGALLPERFYDENARAERVRMWESALAETQTRSRVRIATTRTGGVVGFSIHGTARDEDRDGIELFAVYILEEHYGSGVGQQLIDAAIGDDPACLWVAAGNPRAIRFYEKNGFQPDGTRKTDPDIDNLEEVRMVRG